MTKRLRLVCLITSIALLVSVLAGTGAYVIVNHINSNATINGNFTSIGNLINSSDKSQIDANTYKALKNALGSYGSTARTAADIRSANGGNAVVFQMGEVNGNPIYWQVVYQVGDIITIWMTDCYTSERYNSTSSSYTISSNNLTLLQTYISSSYPSYNKYSQYANYSQSILRDLTNAIYKKLAADNPVLTEVVKSPSAAGATWQETTTAQPDSYYTSTSYKSHHNALKDPSGTGYYTSEFVWDTGTTGPYYDSFWIPSWYETMNSSTSTASLNGGLWGLTAEERGYNDGSDSSSTIKSLDGTAYNSSSAIYPYSCWLRSGSL